MKAGHNTVLRKDDMIECDDIRYVIENWIVMITNRRFVQQAWQVGPRGPATFVLEMARPLQKASCRQRVRQAAPN